MEHLIFTVIVWVWVVFSSLIVLWIILLVWYAFLPLLSSLFLFWEDNVDMFNTLKRIYKLSNYRRAYDIKNDLIQFIKLTEEKYNKKS